MKQPGLPRVPRSVSTELNMKLCFPLKSSATNVTRFTDHISAHRQDALKRVKRGHWLNKKHRKEFFDWVGTQLGINGEGDMEKWYSVSAKQLVEHGGNTLIRSTFRGSMLQALQSVYPNYNWEPWRFEGHTPRSFWANSDNQRKYLEWVAKQKGYKTPEDWYNITSAQIIKLNGKGFISTYKGSVYQALKAVFPEYDWKPWKFKGGPKNYWNNHSGDKSGIAVVIQELAEHLNITHLDDWYRVSVAQIRELGFQPLLKKFGNLYNILKIQYPDHPWDIQRFNSAQKKSGQRWLHVLLKKIFHGEEIMEDYHHPDLVFSSKLPMEFDIFLPKLKLGFEYQGRQHYDDVFRFAPQKLYESRDIEKKELAAAKGITLIEVPYWWDRSVESLVATIKQHNVPVQPNSTVFSGNGKPIPMTPPEQKARRRDHLMNSVEWKGQDVQGWWMTEKLDGLRVMWDGKKLVTKKGKALMVPQSFIAQLPSDVQLDGELWVGYGGYLALMEALFGNQSDTSLFDKIKFVVFDTPTLELPYTQRLEQLKKITLDAPVVVGEIVQCKSSEHMKEYLQQAIHRGAEGVLAWHPLNKYQRGTSEGFVHVMVCLLCMAVLMSKAEFETHVKVINKHESLGLLCEQLGHVAIKLIVNRVNGAQCVIRCPAQMMMKPPPEGTILTVKHAGYFPTGRLKYPLFSEIRNDLQWDQVVQSTETVPYRGQEPSLAELVAPEVLFEQKLLARQLKNNK